MALQAYLTAGRDQAVTSAQRVQGFEAVPPLADTLPGFDMVETQRSKTCA